MLRWITFVLALAAVAAEAAAASISVNPVRAMLALDQRVIALTVRNSGSAAVRVQAQPMRWLAEGAEDSYTATDELVVNPVLFELQPGATQIVRIGLRHARPAMREGSYRLYLTELPGPVGAGFQGLAMSLRLGVPIFVQPPQPAQPALLASLRRNAGALEMAVGNSGQSHARLVEAEWFDASGATLGKVPLARDVLPGQRRQLLLDSMPAHPSATRLHVHVDPASADLDLPLPAP